MVEIGRVSGVVWREMFERRRLSWNNRDEIK